MGSEVSPVERILQYSLVSDLPLRLTTQDEWHEFAPLCFLLVQAQRPERILEVGTTAGDSYLALCQAVLECNLGAMCVSIPDWRIAAGYPELTKQFNEFRRHHDEAYGRFSRIHTDAVLRGSDNEQQFNLIHIVAPGSAQELELLCRDYLPSLSPTGTALISGLDRTKETTVSTVINHAPQFASRIVRLHHSLAIVSQHPIGVARELISCSQDDFGVACRLLRVLGDRARSHVGLLREVNSRRLESTELRGELEWLKETSKLLQEEVERLRTATREDDEKLKAPLVELQDSDVDANIRFGHSDLLLGRTWAENQELRRALALAKGEETPAVDPKQPEKSPATEDRFAKTANRLLDELCERYAGGVPAHNLAGKELWDDCGRSILSAILTRDEPLRFRTPSAPKMSVVLVLHNKAHLSILALCALLLDVLDYEVIVVDNASSDETRDMLARIAGVRVIHNSENRGFAPAVMQAIRAARGEFLCLLNNDALLRPGALARAVATFTERPGTGVVGGKVLLANGRLQEAGCIIWRDGRPMQYGRGDDPDLPQYNFQRPVDYCSGVFLVTPMELFRALGGLDRLYETAYYEDADYCMKVWHYGKAVIYEPRAIVEHYEAASSSNQLAALDLFISNHQKFTEKWRHSLHLHQAEKSSGVLKARIAAACKASPHLYIVDTAGEAVLRAKLAEHFNPPDRCGVATVLYAGDLDLGVHANEFGIDVELRDLAGMAPDEIEAYSSASETITVIAERTSIGAILPLLVPHAGKTTYIRDSPVSPSLVRRKAT